MRTLHAWHRDELIGRFEEHPSGSITFTYAEGARIPLSLSLPIGGHHEALAANNYLLNLVPENDAALLALREAKGLRTVDPFDILDRLDTAGGLTYTLSDEAPSLRPQPIIRLTMQAIAAEIDAAEARQVGDSALFGRFSLCGAMPKFTMSLIDGSWYVPSSDIPSTHIVKPCPSRYEEAVSVELATLDLAELCGISAVPHGKLEVMGRTAYLTERFDRKGIGSWGCERLHVEDLAQAMGLSPKDKYDVTLEDVVSRLRTADETGELSYEFLASFMFNAYAGNADAHVKNYSLVYGPGTIGLAPLYDALTTSCWPGLDASLPISLNYTYFEPENLTLRTWEVFSRRNALDPDRVTDMALDIAARIRDRMPIAMSGLATPLYDRALRQMMRNTDAVFCGCPTQDRDWVVLYEDAPALPGVAREDPANQEKRSLRQAPQDVER